MAGTIVSRVLHCLSLMQPSFSLQFLVRQECEEEEEEVVKDIGS